MSDAETFRDRAIRLAQDAKDKATVDTTAAYHSMAALAGDAADASRVVMTAYRQLLLEHGSKLKSPDVVDKAKLPIRYKTNVYGHALSIREQLILLVKDTQFDEIEIGIDCEPASVVLDVNIRGHLLCVVRVFDVAVASPSIYAHMSTIYDRGLTAWPDTGYRQAFSVLTILELFTATLEHAFGSVEAPVEATNSSTQEPTLQEPAQNVQKDPPHDISI